MSEPFDEYGYDEFGDLVDEEEWDLEDCSYGSFGMPAMGTEECDCYCPGSKGCWAMYNSQPDCLSVKARTNEDNEYMMPCPWFYCGKCYVHFYKHTIRGALTRLKCAFGFLPVSRRAE
jgi:hypothetical protein